MNTELRDIEIALPKIELVVAQLANAGIFKEFIFPVVLGVLGGYLAHSLSRRISYIDDQKKS